MTHYEKLRAGIATALLAAFSFALALAASPELHARFHPDANVPNHECAVTLIAAGKYEKAGPPVTVTVPQPAVLLENTPPFVTVWVAALFLNSAIFEHAPPALS